MSELNEPGETIETLRARLDEAFAAERDADEICRRRRNELYARHLAPLERATAEARTRVQLLENRLAVLEQGQPIRYQEVAKVLQAAGFRRDLRHGADPGGAYFMTRQRYSPRAVYVDACGLMAARVDYCRRMAAALRQAGYTVDEPEYRDALVSHVLTVRKFGA